MPAAAAEGGGGFDFTEIAGLKVWYDFSDIATLWQDEAQTSPITTDGQTILGVTDKSGEANHLMQTTNQTGIVYEAAVVDTLSVGRLSAAAHGLSATAGLVGATAGTLFYVSKALNDPQPADREGAVVNRWGTAASYDHFPYQDGTVYYAWGSDTRHNTGNPTASLATAYRIICVRSTSAAWTMYIDGGTAHFSTDAGSVAWEDTPGIGFIDGLGFSWAGDICDVLMWDSDLSVTDKNIVGNALEAKWVGTTWNDVS